MKKINFISGTLLLTIMLLATSCYKTGEIIYQTTCKPTEIDIPDNLYKLDYQLAFGLKAGITYGYSNRRPVTMIIKGWDGTNYAFFTFEYDNNNNLIRQNRFFDYNSSSNIPDQYINYSYPAGTASSISDKIDVQQFTLNEDGFSYKSDPLQTYEYNTEFQLTSIKEGTAVKETYLYDNGGNLQRIDLHMPDNSVTFHWQFDSYDDKINLARSDRYLQLFLGVYSKNNATLSKQVWHSGPDGIPMTQTLKADYTYNNNGYPVNIATGFNPFGPEEPQVGPLYFFAGYNCAN
jgi:hypothetical protein